MIRFPQNSTSGLRLTGSANEEEDVLAEARINGGMVTSIDEVDLENNQFVAVNHATVRYDKTSRQYGTELLTPTKPDSNRVLHLVTYERFGGDVSLIRFTPSTVYEHSSSAWTAQVGVLSGAESDRFRTAIINNRLFFANNGADVIQELDVTANTFAALGNAPRYKFIIGFNNRVVGANLVGSPGSTIQIGWSGNLNFGVWDTASDPSAGSVSLIDTNSDLSDNISGLFGFTDSALMLRERSLWGITKQPVASNPFNFFPIFPGIGCDSPYSAVAIHNGIAWFDIRSGTVYAFKVGDKEPTPIGRPIEKSLLAQVVTAGTVYGTYNPLHDEYSVCVPDSSTGVRIWTFNFRSKAWAYEERTDLSCIATIDYASQELTIDQLSGMINDLTGTIDELGISIELASRLYGYDNGEIRVENNLSDLDNGSPYTMEIRSKNWRAPVKKFYVQKLAIEYIPRLEGSFTLAYSKDGGANFTNYKTITFDNDDAGIRKLVTCTKHLQCNQFQWKLTSTDGLFDLMSYEITRVPANAPQRQRS